MLIQFYVCIKEQWMINPKAITEIARVLHLLKFAPLLVARAIK